MLINAYKEKIDKKRVINFRATDKEIKIIRELARKYYNSNVSGWLRWAALNCRPKKSDLIEIKD